MTEIIWSPGVTLEMIEKQVILMAYKFYQSNKTTTARVLDISIRTLDAKLDKYEGRTASPEPVALIEEVSNGHKNAQANQRKSR